MRIFNADCMDVLKTLESESVDLIVTDPPYKIVGGGCTNIPRKDEPSGIFNRRAAWTQKNAKTGKLFDNNDIAFSTWLPEVYRVLKPNTHCYIMISPRNLCALQTCAERVGFQFQNILIWSKNNSTPNRYYLNSYEMILMLRKGKAKNINNMGTKNVLTIKNIIGNKQHPTEKPVELMRIFIENSSNEGDVVLDPFMGVGSTGVACMSLNRDFIGIEIDESFFNVAKANLEKPQKPSMEVLLKGL